MEELKEEFHPAIQEIPAFTYKHIKNDAIDEEIAKLINDERISIPIVRLGEGRYLFGTVVK